MIQKHTSETQLLFNILAWYIHRTSILIQAIYLRQRPQGELVRSRAVYGLWNVLVGVQVPPKGPQTSRKQDTCLTVVAWGHLGSFEETLLAQAHPTRLAVSQVWALPWGRGFEGSRGGEKCPPSPAPETLRMVLPFLSALNTLSSV